MIAKYNNLKVEIIKEGKCDYLIQLDERPDMLYYQRCFTKLWEYF